MTSLSIARAVVATAGCLFPAGLRAADRSPQDDARITLRQTVDCWVETDLYFHRGEGVRALIGQSPTKTPSNWASVDTRVTLMRCLGSRTTKGETYVAELRFTPILLRGAAFRALYLQQFGSKKLPPLKPIVVDPPWRVESSDGFSLLQQFGECVVAEGLYHLAGGDIHMRKAKQ